MSRGYSSSVANAALLPIVTTEAGSSNIGWTTFKWVVEDKQLIAWSKEVQKAFDILEGKVNQQARKLRREGGQPRDSITLPRKICHEQLKNLAYYGMLAFRGLFPDKARQLLSERIESIKPLVPAPTFVSKLTPFPWEVLYQGDDDEDPDPDMFWGLEYSMARILDMRDISMYARERDPISKMLFCLHHKLCEAHQGEWPNIERLVKATNKDHVLLLGPIEPLMEVVDSKSFLSHLYKSEHNMLHFACHAMQLPAGNDALEISLIRAEELLHAANTDLKPQVVTLETNTFLLTEGSFLNRPLVFLNACHSGGGADELRDSYNLPLKFVERDAGAVIATACPVPDVFAAEFARIFYGFFLWGRVIDDEIPSRAEAQPMSIGEALRQTRRYFLEVHHNPLGLAYGLYSPAHYQVIPSPISGGKDND
jgi:hypothetical protein